MKRSERNKQKGEKIIKTTLTLIVLLSLACLTLAAQNEVDYQLRTLVHLQLANTNGQGIAAWLIAPDLTKTQPFRFLAVGGWLNKEEKNWQEYMAGALFGADGLVQPTLNLRSYAKAKKSDLYAELTLRSDRGIASSFATYPLGKFRLDLETELAVSLKSGVKSDGRLGPRLSFKVPGADRLTVATSALFDIRGKTVVRTYLLYNLWPKPKR